MLVRISSIILLRVALNCRPAASLPPWSVEEQPISVCPLGKNETGNNKNRSNRNEYDRYDVHHDVSPDNDKTTQKSPPTLTLSADKGSVTAITCRLHAASRCPGPPS
jgi:hypothetical protein